MSENKQDELDKALLESALKVPVLDRKQPFIRVLDDTVVAYIQDGHSFTESGRFIPPVKKGK